MTNLAESANLQERTFFIDEVSPEEILSYTSSADVGISPIENTCLSYYYCLPNKLFEYLMAGLPVAVSDFPEMAKIVKEYEVGEVFDPEDPQDIARAINAILRDEKKYQQYKENAKKASEVFNWENESKRLVNLYKELL